MAYKERYLYKTVGDATGNITLNDIPSAYDRIRVSYSSPTWNDIRTTSFSNYAPMTTIEYDPKSFSYLALRNPFYGTLTTATANYSYNACSLYSAVNTTSWKNIFNKYGANNTYTATANAPWVSIESVIGIRHNEYNVNPTKKVLLYDANVEGNTLSLRDFPSAYDRIGIYSDVSKSRMTAYTAQYSIGRYSEIPFSILSAENYMLAASTWSEGGSAGKITEGITIYSGCSSKNWSLIKGYRSQMGSNSLVATNEAATIKRIVGINL